MAAPVFYTPDITGALGYAVDILKGNGCAFTTTASDSVTHLLLGAPATDFETLLQPLPKGIPVIGIKLPQLPHHPGIDLLEDADFVAKNADITARCAISLAASKLPVTWKNLPVLVVGWGRIGKCLARLLKSQDAAVTVLARKPEARGMLRALGYTAVETPTELHHYRVILNTADNAGIRDLPPESLSIDLASTQGLTGENVLWARGLPGKIAPEDSGKLIARTVLRLLQ